MKDPNRFPVLIPLVTLVFAAAHLLIEHLTGGLKSHHLLNRPDLPAISNWFELVTLPLLGVVLGLRIRSHPSSKCWLGIPVSVLIALLGSLVYGGVMASSFLTGPEIITTAAFLGMFVCGFVLPVYRVEYILGFVAGMSVIIGGVLPLPVALVVASVSFIVRFVFGKVAGALRRQQGG